MPRYRDKDNCLQDVLALGQRKKSSTAFLTTQGRPSLGVHKAACSRNVQDDPLILQQVPTH